VLVVLLILPILVECLTLEVVTFLHHPLYQLVRVDMCHLLPLVHMELSNQGMVHLNLAMELLLPMDNQVMGHLLMVNLLMVNKAMVNLNKGITNLNKVMVNLSKDMVNLNKVMVNQGMVNLGMVNQATDNQATDNQDILLHLRDTM
jgi:hypothetical protein